MFLSILYSIVQWSIAVGLYALIRFYGTHDTIADWALNTQMIFVMWILVSVLVGILYSGTTAIINKPRMRRKSYGFLIIFRVASMVIMTIVILFLSRIGAYAVGQIPAHEIVPTFMERLTYGTTVAFVVYLGIVTGLLGFIKQMVGMVGGRVLVNILLGRYHNPKEEERIFMFLDLKSSTTHAEKLGHTRFCRLIQDCFHDLTDSAIAHNVEIYQYVGDEAILTWTVSGGTTNSNCVKVFFDFERELQNQRESYQQKYGFVPEFKAGVNMGPVTVAEIGDIKRDIAYLSDVLNTAARIQDECNKYNRKLLISDSVKNQIAYDTSLRFESIGEIALKGKSEIVELFNVELE